jgi:Cu(I)/Ag(I) efflux system membrane fusion protein
LKQLAAGGKASPTTTFYSTASGFITSIDVQEGAYIMEGGTIVKLADLSTLWAEAQVFASQLSEIETNSVATVQLPDFDGREVKGKIEFINPEINPATRINLIRVSVSNASNQLKPGMPAYVLLRSPRRTTITLPIDALIRDRKGATAWLRTGRNSFKRITVETGLESYDRIEIRSGIRAGDVVVVAGAYLLQSEWIFKKSADNVAKHEGSGM